MKKWIIFGSSLLVSAYPLYLLSRFDFDLFHMIIELFTVIVAFLIFSVSVISLKFHKTNVITYMGPGMLVISGIIFLHALTYPGMNLIQGYDGNLTTQLWVVLNYILVLNLLFVILFKNRKFSYRTLTYINLAAGITLVYLCFARIFPACFIEGTGLTPFKKISEFVIIGIYLLILAIMYFQRAKFNKSYYLELVITMILLIFSEFVFTLYRDSFGIIPFIGHFIRLVAFINLYITFAIESVQKPYERIFEELQELAVTDGLTRLYNSRYLYSVLDKYKSKDHAHKSIYLFMFDVDRFKSINDGFGHEIGDQILVEIAHLLNSMTRITDTVARQGGDEFTVVFYDISSTDVKHLVNRIRAAISENEFSEKKIHITISGGLKKFDGSDIKTLIKKTDDLLYKAKELGRDKICD